MLVLIAAVVYNAAILMPFYGCLVMREMCGKSGDHSDTPPSPCRNALLLAEYWQEKETRTQDCMLLHGTVQGKRRGGRQRKRWAENIAQWTGKNFATSQAAMRHSLTTARDGDSWWNVRPCSVPTTPKGINRLVGLVVKASAWRAGDPGFESRLCRDFPGVESYQ